MTDFMIHMHLRNYTVDFLLKFKFKSSCLQNCGTISPSPYIQLYIYASVFGSVPRVWLHFDFIFVVAGERYSLILKSAHL